MNQLFGLQHRGDRYLSHNSRHTQVPVPATTTILNKTNKKKSPVAEATGPDEDHNFTGLGPVVM